MSGDQLDLDALDDRALMGEYLDLVRKVAQTNREIERLQKESGKGDEAP